MAEEADAATPAARAANERAALSSMYEAHHLNLKAEEAEEKATAERKRQAELIKQENIHREAARVAAARKAEDDRRREARDRQSAKLLADDAKRQILGYIRQYDVMDKLDELQVIVRREGMGMTSVLSWETACRELSKR
jgi:thioesterase domain-containing protein